MSLKIRPAKPSDAERVQTLRNKGWQDNYQYSEGGVTLERLKSDLAPLPPSNEHIEYFLSKLEKDMRYTLVAEEEDEVVGVAFCQHIRKGWCDIGVFIERERRATGIGSRLLRELIDFTTCNLEVTIFSNNISRNFYKKCGFVERGDQFIHHFDDHTYLPVQTLELKRA